MSFILQNVGIAWKGPNYVSLPVGILPHGTIFTVGKNAYHWDDLIVVLLTVPVLLTLIWLVQYTKQGKAMRATAQDREAAAMMGIDVNRTISFTFLIAGWARRRCRVDLRGLLHARSASTRASSSASSRSPRPCSAASATFPAPSWERCSSGSSSRSTTRLGWHAPGSDWTQSIVFSILILILVFRPEGILGERTPEGG